MLIPSTQKWIGQKFNPNFLTHIIQEDTNILEDLVKNFAIVLHWNDQPKA
jgi:hypothetical protein